jgi:glycosyltransferase involved in cell wall biosynthesis
MLKKRSIPSVLKQTYKNFELVVVSDGSTDNSHKVIRSFKDKRIRYFKIKRKKRYFETVENHWFAGPVYAINKGLSEVKGDWIARIDDDDIWTKDHLNTLLNFALKKKKEFVSSAHHEYRYGKKIIQNHKNFSPRIGGVQSWLYASYLKFFKANKDCWRKTWNKVNDLDLQDRMYRVGVKMGYCNKVTVILKPRPGDKTIGIEAYKNKKNYYLKKYEFRK